ncbi:8-oxo-dGTP pyrophosphatase MutT (NUDIX family) [Primorskyibacter sedentarius]|uniref:8-oxo-dGTP pyrophosphatase MutT (NUDIX family) n=1 Tax=Primorskyibacter sedentarius TaxID=745311 RepID=A0A4R3JHH2_9RHOB|nr:NUDIX hydrolase [Primorskyibacter sedentarius]TCS65599.1 8-oxo-dGTP pyrophosphatase MutT (NUDIX family) [Primorskyibacter sedentarius]
MLNGKPQTTTFRTVGPGGLHTQCAALCYRIRKGKPQILLITTRGSNRWILPKGWPVPGKTPGQSAQVEAWEEAGVRGALHDQCIGLFTYFKAGGRQTGMTCMAMVHPLKVKALSKTYPEAGQRKRKWFGRKKAAAYVQEPELAQLLLHFDPKTLQR